MNFHVLTLFPQMVENGLNNSILGRAAAQGRVSFHAHDIREYTTDKHRKVDDYPYGGGAGMLMQAQPVFDCFQTVKKQIEENTPSQAEKKKLRVVYLTPQGETFTQEKAQELSKEENLVLLCGHYEGIDERVLEETVTDYVSIGDYVLTGGELAAMVVIDAIARLVGGVLNNEESAQTETFHNHLLEYPQYSRPEEWRGKKVPEVLLSGNHKKIREWRLEQSVERTKERRPDMYKIYERIEKCVASLGKDKLLHIDMIEPLKRGHGELLYWEEDGILIKEKESGAYMISAKSLASGEKILSVIDEEPEQFVSHQSFLNESIIKKFQLQLQCECANAVYTRKESLPVQKNWDIRPLDKRFQQIIFEQYHTFSDEAYIAERVKSGVMYGIFEENALAGFIGMHREGSIGMLEILEPYRKKGYGRALETFYINRHLQQGFTPFGQIITGNQASEKLQQSLHLYISKEKSCWFGK